MRVRAAVQHAYGEPLDVCELELDEPRAGEVLVRVAAAGVCHTDVHLADGNLGADRHPIVLGHEGAGVVEALGDGVAGLEPGDPVAFCFVPSCGACGACAAGRRNLCEAAAAAAWAGALLDGTARIRLADGRPVKHFNFISCFAERCVVPAACAVPIPRELPLWQASLLGCGVVTAVGAVRNAARVAAGESVCVIGCGGVGLQLVAAARLAGAGRVIAVERDPAKRALALRRGATDAVAADDALAALRRGATHAVAADDALAAVLALAPGGVDHAFEAVGSPATMRLAWDVLRPGATATVVGIAPAGAEVALPARGLLSEKGIRGSYYGSGDPAALLSAMARETAAGRFPVADVVTHVTDLDGIDAAFARLRDGAGARTVALVDRALAGEPRLHSGQPLVPHGQSS